jgi:hypothetical protein
MESGFGSEPTPRRQPICGVTEKFCLHCLEAILKGKNPNVKHYL